MSNDKILSKIQKCLALAKSSNPNEAAAALRQAQKLMEKHGYSSEDVDLLTVNASDHAAGAAQNPPRWHSWLVSVICNAFGVSSVYVVGYNETKVQFIGIESQAEIAGYAYDVLHRQIRRDRQAHISEQKRCKRATKTRRGDLFAEAWVRAVSSSVTAFAQQDAHKQLIQTWMEKQYDDLEPTKSREHKAQAHDHKSQVQGYLKGREAELNRGMGADHRQQLEAQS